MRAAGTQGSTPPVGAGRSPQRPPAKQSGGDNEVLFATQDGVQTFSLLWALGEDFEKLFEVAERVRLVLAADEVMHPLSQAGIRGMRGTKWLD